MIGEPKMPTVNENNAEQEKIPVRTFFIRHSKALYRNYADQVGSETPEAPMNLSEQLPDLTEAGVELAEKSAHEFLSGLDPAKDVLYIVSSSQTRAVETAEIYIQVAEIMGFEVVNHQESLSSDQPLAKGAERGDGKIRTLENLSLHLDNQVYGALFNQPAYMPEINWEKVDPETKRRFDEAREIILADDKGSWGGNFQAYAQVIKSIIPEMETPKELYHGQYEKLVRLADFARRKADGEKRVNVLAFGHENYMGYALEHDTHEESIANTEAVELTEDGMLKRLT